MTVTATVCILQLIRLFCLALEAALKGQASRWAIRIYAAAKAMAA